RPADGLARRRKRDGTRRREPRPAGPLYRERRILRRARAGAGELLQTLERRLSGLGGKPWILRQTSAIPLRALVRATAAVPAGRRGAWRPPAARTPAAAAEAGDGSAACMVSAIR